MSDLIQLRAGPAALWALRNSVLAQREPGLESDTGLMKIGDGLTAWNDLPYWHGGEVDPASFAALQNEVVEARGNRTTLDKRISMISRYSSPIVGRPLSGDVVDNNITSAGPTTGSGLANALRLVPWMTAYPIQTAAIGIRVTVGVSASTCRFLVYESGDDGWPSVPIFESDPVSTAGAGPVLAPMDMVLDSDRQYWMGYWTSHNPTVHAVQAYSAPNCGAIGGIAGITYAGLIQRSSLPYAGNAAPSPFGLVSSERVAGNPPRIMIVVA